MSEPNLKYCTVREGDAEWHLECRFFDGQKYAAIRVDGACPDLAHRIAALLNGGSSTWTTDRPTEPGEYWVSIPPSRQRTPRVESVSVQQSPFDSQLMVEMKQTTWRHPVGHSYFDGAKWSRRETPADPFQEVTK